MAWWSDLAAKLKVIFSAVPGGFDWETAGPEEDEHPLVPIGPYVQAAHGPAFVDGWWDLAQRRPAHEGRIGRTIVPSCVVVHTTDTYGGFDAMVKSWTTAPGAGNAAHFMIGRGPSDGVVQFAPIVRNANHAGGKVHGNFKGAKGGLVHPNTCSVGIEMVAAGRLTLTDGVWVHKESGHIVSKDEVFVDEKGHGWQVVTDYQLRMLDMLLTDLEDQLQPFDGVQAIPDMDYAKAGVSYYAPFPDSRIVGHVTLDPVNRCDPGPQVMAHLKAR